MGKDELLQAVADFEDILRTSASIADGDLDGQRKRGIDLRRQIAVQTSRIASLGDTAFEPPVDRAEFREQFSRMRSAMAFHQASWPIVAVDLNNPSYRASLQTTREANRVFIAWTRNSLGRR